MRRHSSASSLETVRRYVESTLASGNLIIELFLQIEGYFDVGWTKSLEQLITAEIKDAIESVRNDRNRIAHGDDVGVTFVRISSHYAQIKSLVQALDKLANP